MVDVFAWNPVRPHFVPRPGRHPSLRLHAENFGDLLARRIVRRMLELRSGPVSVATDVQLLSVGSVLHLGREGAVVWGTGRNPKIPEHRHRWSNLDVRAVRGPLTASFLRARGVEVPNVQGDPALLAAQLLPELRASPTDDRYPVTVIPNLNERGRFRSERHPATWLLDPSQPLETVLRRIAASELVVTSSLHALVIADSFGVPARQVSPVREHPDKYRDYFEGTGRSQPRPAVDVNEALRLGGVEPPVLDTGALKAAFPYDLWGLD